MAGKEFRKTSREAKGTNERRTRKQTKRWSYANRRRNWYCGRPKFTRLLLLLVKQQSVIWIKICHEHGDVRLGHVERKTTADVVAFRSATNDKDQRQSKRRSCCKAENICSRRPWKSCQDIYACKRPDKMKTSQSPFCFAINYTTKAVKKKPWFKSAPMGVYKLNLLMTITAEKC